ncbi:MAG: outer membrane lipoprotein chaperone LolA [Thiogranum sp.]|nr:outer membrane lipoprotein chaperone LolA [Thiogranum sp.]
MNRKRISFAGFAWSILALFPMSGSVRAADLVSEYFSGLDSFQAQFTQVVVDSNGQQLQDSAGEVWMQRPGRFRWDYHTPYRQLIVADGESIWTYDADLEQATVKAVDEALSSTPAMLLSGFRPLSEVMTWQQLDEKNGSTLYRLDPKQADSAVEQVQIAFDGKQLSSIDVRDGFGNQTRIRFSGVKRNQPIDPERFRLKLPPGTDIIGDVP